MLPVAVSLLLLCAACGGVLPPSGDKGYVVDGALGLAQRSFLRNYTLPSVSETFSERFGLVNVLFTLALSPGNLQVEELSRRGNVTYRESPSEPKFEFRGLLRSRVNCNFNLYGGETSVLSGNAVIHWDVEFNGSLVTKSCNLVMESAPFLESITFHPDLFAEKMKMNISYNEHPFSSIITVYMPPVTVLVQRSLSEIPICDAIQC